MKLSELFFPGESRQEPHYTEREVRVAAQLLEITNAAIENIEHARSREGNWMRATVGSAATERVVQTPAPQPQSSSSVVGFESYPAAPVTQPAPVAQEQQVTPAEDNSAYISYLTAEPEQVQQSVSAAPSELVQQPVAPANSLLDVEAIREQVAAAAQRGQDPFQFPITMFQEGRDAQEAA